MFRVRVGLGGRDQIQRDARETQPQSKDESGDSLCLVGLKRNEAALEYSFSDSRVPRNLPFRA